MASLNLHLTIGNLTKDATLNYTGKGVAVLNWRSAISTEWKEKKEVLYLDFACFGGTAETLNKLGAMVKGACVFVEGRLQAREWDDKEGVKRTSYTVLAQHVQLLDRKPRPAQDEAIEDFDRRPAEDRGNRKESKLFVQEDSESDESLGDLPF